MNELTDPATISLVFDDLAPQEMPVRVLGVDYLLREASAGAVCKWRNHLTAATKMSDGKVVGVGNVADAEPLLVSLCLFHKDGKAVAENAVRAFPGRYLKPLYEAVVRLSGLQEVESDEPVLKRVQADFRRLSATGRAELLNTLPGLHEELSAQTNGRSCEELAKN